MLSHGEAMGKRREQRGKNDARFFLPMVYRNARANFFLLLAAFFVRGLKKTKNKWYSFDTWKPCSSLSFPRGLAHRLLPRRKASGKVFSASNDSLAAQRRKVRSRQAKTKNQLFFFFRFISLSTLLYLPGRGWRSGQGKSTCRGAC